jgi:hypothetical protein
MGSVTVRTTSAKAARKSEFTDHEKCADGFGFASSSDQHLESRTLLGHVVAGFSPRSRLRNVASRPA